MSLGVQLSWCCQDELWSGKLVSGLRRESRVWHWGSMGEVHVLFGELVLMVKSAVWVVQGLAGDKVALGGRWQ